MQRRVVGLAALGYFIDILDLFLFSVLRIPSLSGLGVPSAEYLRAGVMLQNWQLGGLLLGSFVWGTLGDRRGRVRALYGSLLLYSLATLGNAAVSTLPGYAACRFLAGLGLAGELGAAITLVSETLPTARRGLGTTLVAGCGLCGGIAAAGLAVLLPWRSCYVVGGASGLVLLALRVQLLEPELFRRAESARGRGSLLLLFRRPARALAYGRLILIGLPIWFVAGILMLLSPEFAAALGVGGAGPGAGVTAAKAVLYSYIGAALGDFACGLLSQKLRSRKRALFLSLLAVLGGILLYLHAAGLSPAGFYLVCFLVGLTTGYWAVLITAAAEHFGTNLRATVTTSVPNLVRAGVIPISLLFQWLHPRLGLVRAATGLGVGLVALALLALFGLRETYSRELDFVEN
jgi:MFS family permease